MITETITITDNGLIERLENTPDIVAQEARNFLEIVLGYIHRLVKVLTPVGISGLLRGSITIQPITGTKANLTGTVSTSSIYGEAVELGTKPHWAPIGPLKLWALRVLGDEGLAYAVRWKIKRKGTKGAHMFKKAFEQSKAFVATQQQTLAEKIARRIDGR